MTVWNATATELQKFKGKVEATGSEIFNEDTNLNNFDKELEKWTIELTDIYSTNNIKRKALKLNHPWKREYYFDPETYIRIWPGP